MPVIDELRIRNVDAEIALRLTSMAKKHGMSRSEYVKGILTNHVLSSQVKELDNQYQGGSYTSAVYFRENLFERGRIL